MRIKSENSVAVCVDLQEKLFAVVHDNMELEGRLVTILTGLSELNVPVITTEQYPKGLGHTIDPLKVIMDGALIEKSTFSCVDDEVFESKLNSLQRKTVIVFGIEAHVCVLQTTVDLLEKGYEVFVVVDCISSRNVTDKDIALRRLEKEGAYLTTVETLLFELCQDSKSPSFKVISSLVK